MKRIGLVLSSLALVALAACTRVGDLTSTDASGTRFENAAPNRQTSDQKEKKYSGAALGTSRNLVADENGVRSNWAGNTPPGAATFTIDKAGMPVFAAETPSDIKVGEFGVVFGKDNKPERVTVKNFEARKTDAIVAGNAALDGWVQYIKNLPANQVQAIKEAAAAGNEFAKILVPAIEALATGGTSTAVGAAAAGASALTK